jgi:signal transduction histidine kinase
LREKPELTAKEARRDFLRRFFHDLATPLSAVALHLEGADRRVQRGADPSEPLQIARAELARAFELFEHGRECLLGAQGDVETFSFDALVDSAVQTGGVSAPAIEGQTEGWVTGNRHALEQALAALVANAVEAAGADTVRIRRERLNSCVRAVVENPGRLAASDPERMFSPQAAGAGRKWGMGLPRARLQAADAGGRIWLQQTENQVIAILELPEETLEDPHR